MGDESLVSGERPISFNSATPNITRAVVGADAADLLNYNFVVFGYKTVGSAQTVFDNYQVNYVNASGSSAGSTESNTAGWEYVSYKNLPGGVGTTAGVTAFAATTTGDPNNSAGIEQSIKYWDFSASSYDFFAYSLGDGATSTWAKASAMNKTGYGDGSSHPGYTLEGTADQLGTCYISNKKNVVPSTSATEVDLEFRSFLSKIELKFYETIPGYSVKSLSFYPSAAGASGTTPYLYASDSKLPTGGKYEITFDANGKAQLKFDTDADSKTYGSNIVFSETLTDYAARDYQEANVANTYIGRASNGATKTNEISVLPNPQNDQALHLKMDFTLVSRDGSGETINMTAATAVVPAAYAMWKPNYKYTYIFKISDNTNAKTAAITGLYPITLDAVVKNDVDGTQETITTVDDPSITTYAKGTMVTANNEYKTGANIYIVVNDGTNITAGSDAKLYTATIQDGAAQGITEETVANALEHGTESPTGTWTVTDANDKNLVVTTSDLLSDITEIAANDAPDGHAITVDGVKFTPAAAGYYVFEYSAAAVNYDAAGAAAYNAALPGALPTDGTTGLTADQANAYNAKLTGAVKTGDAVPADYATKVGSAAAGATLTAEEAIAYNSHLDGAKAADNTLTAEQANTYNATLPGHVSSGDVKTPAAKHYKVIKVVN